MRVRLAVALGLVLILGVLVGALSRTEDRYLGSNSRVRASQHKITVPPSRTRCQREDVPASASRLRLFANTRGPAGPLSVRVRRGPRTIAAGATGRINGEGAVTVVLRPALEEPMLGAAVCLENRGVRHIFLAGNETLLRVGPAPLPKASDEKPRVDYFAEGSSTWWTRFSEVADRSGMLKASFFGPWTMWAALLVGLAASGLGLRILLRELRL